MHVTQGLERYLRHQRASGATPKTLAWHDLSIGQFAQFLTAVGHSGDVDAWHADDLRGWIGSLRDRGLAQASICTKVRSVKALSRWLVAEDWLPKDPFARVSQPKVDDKPMPTLSPADVDKLLTTCDRRAVTGARDFAIMLLLFSTGLRLSEVLHLAVDDLDWDRGLATVARGKGGKLRVVPLGRPAERAILRYLDHPKRAQFGLARFVFLSDAGDPMSVSALQSTLKRRGQRAGVHANCHKFRHSASIQYLRSGGRVEALKTMLGHSDLSMTLHYARIAGVDLVQAHDQADPARALRTRV